MMGSMCGPGSQMQGFEHQICGEKPVPYLVAMTGYRAKTAYQSASGWESLNIMFNRIY